MPCLWFKPSLPRKMATGTVSSTEYVDKFVGKAGMEPANPANFLTLNTLPDFCADKLSD